MAVEGRSWSVVLIARGELGLRAVNGGHSGGGMGGWLCVG